MLDYQALFAAVLDALPVKHRWQAPVVAKLLYSRFQQALSEDAFAARVKDLTDGPLILSKLNSSGLTILVGRDNYAPITQIGSISVTFLREEATNLPTAKALFNTLSSLVLPDRPTPPPRGSLPPRGPGAAALVGREQALRDIAAALKGAAGQSRPGIVICGIDGIGKTSLTRTFVDLYGQYFAGGIFWISCAEALSVPKQVAACAGPRAMNLPGHSELTMEQQVGLTLAAWRSPMPRLIVFDSCDDLEIVRRYTPSGGGCRLIVTSHRSDWFEPDFKLLRLPALDLQCGVRLLRERAGLDATVAEMLATRLGSFPLGLVLTISSGEDGGDPLAAARRAVGEVVLSSLSKLDLDEQSTLAARRLLAAAARCAPDCPIPALLLTERPALELPRDSAHTITTRALERLVERCLLDRDNDNALRIHRLVADTVRAWEPEDAIVQEAEELIAAAKHVFRPANSAEAVLLEQATPHVLHLAEILYNAQGCNPALLHPTTRLGDTAAQMLENQGAYEQALGWWDRLRNLCEAGYGPADLKTADAVLSLAVCLRKLGRSQEALPLFDRAIGVFKTKPAANLTLLVQALNSKAVATDMPDKAEAIYREALDLAERHGLSDRRLRAQLVKNLGAVLRRQHRFEEARPWLEHARYLFEHIPGSEIEVANTLNSLGVLAGQQGDQDQALQLFHQSLDLYDRTVGEHSHHQLTVLGNLCNQLKEHSDYQQALRYAEREVRITRTSLGELHGDTAAAQGRLAWLLATMGRRAEASGYAIQAFERREALSDREPTERAYMLNILGEALRLCSRHEQACACFEESLGFYRSAGLGEGENAYITRNNLGLSLSILGRHQEAMGHHKRFLDFCLKTRGEMYSLTAKALHNLALDLDALGGVAERERALDYLRRSLAIRERVWGADHPESASCRDSLASVLIAQGDSLKEARRLEAAQMAHGEAEAELGRALGTYERSYSPDHPACGRVLAKLTSLARSRNEYNKARDLAERTVSLYERHPDYGREHPITVDSIGNLASCLRQLKCYSEARPLYEEVLCWHQRHEGDMSQETATTMNNFALMLSDMREHQEARTWFEHILTIRERLSPDHDLRRKAVHNLGLVLKDLGDLPTLREHYSRQLARCEAELNPDAPRTYMLLDEFASAVRDTAPAGLAAARAIYDEVLARWSATYPDRHPRMRGALELYAGLLAKGEDYRRAIEVLSRLLRAYEGLESAGMLGHAEALGNLGAAHAALRKHREARDYYKRALQFMERQAKPDWLTMARWAMNQGLVLRAMGDFQTALACAERAVRLYHEQCGAAHPLVGESLRVRGSIHALGGSLHEARADVEQAIAILRDHDEQARLLAQAWLGAIKIRQGEQERGAACLDLALSILRPRLGNDHPEVVAITAFAGGGTR